MQLRGEGGREMKTKKPEPCYELEDFKKRVEAFIGMPTTMIRRTSNRADFLAHSPTGLLLGKIGVYKNNDLVWEFGSKSEFIPHDDTNPTFDPWKALCAL